MNEAQGGSRVGVLWEFWGDIFRFPLWWYSEGIRDMSLRMFSFVQGYARSLGVQVWIKNIFTPMFGRYDWQSRIISVFIRIMNILVRGFMVCCAAMIAVGIFVFYALLPLFAALFALYHLTGLLL